MRILVTGGAGFIGSHLAHHFVARRHAVLVIDDLSSGVSRNVPPRAELVQMSITDPRITGVVRAFRPDAVCHHAAQVSVPRSVEDPSGDASTNVVGAIRVAHAAAQAGARTLIFASSGGAIYGEQQTFPAAEHHPQRPTSPYGVSKLCGESYLEYFSRSSGIRVVHLRYGNVYGPRQDPHGEAGVVAVFLQRMLRGERITIHGDGLQTRDYVYVEDVVRANAQALASESVHGPVNIGTGIETSVVELVAALAAITGVASPVCHGPPRPGEQRRSVLAIERARSELGWLPRTPLREGLAATAAWFARGARATRAASRNPRPLARTCERGSVA
jgi:UDP-glucose 4-epimerase